MNIYDVYLTSIYTVVDIKYSNISDIDYKASYTKDAIVLKKKDYYIDLFTKKKIKKDIYDCKVGDEFIVPTKRYNPIIDFIDKSDIKKTNISKKKLIKTLTKSVEKKESSI